MGSKRNDFLSSLIEQVATSAELEAARDKQVVDIITFCESKHYLDLLNQDPPLSLWPMQKIVLKMFYRGTRGNEHLKLDESEIEYLRDIAKNENLDYDEAQGGFNQVIDKYGRGTIFTTLLLIMGRRSSKTLMVSLIAAYEAYKLLETPEGNPHKYYGLSPDKPIAILNVAVSAEQAYDPLFLEIESRLSRSPYFIDKINPRVDKKGQLHLLTEADKRENARRLERGNKRLVDGSIVLISGHSNSNSLRGKAAICVLFDEIAHFIDGAGRLAGDSAYNALTPSVKQFGKDGRIVLLSDPSGKDGIFWKLFQMSQEQVKDESEQAVMQDGSPLYNHDYILALQLPTWRMNPSPDLTKEVLLKEEQPKNPLGFLSTWGARFTGEEGTNFFDDRKIENCIDHRLQPVLRGDPRYVYHIHLDPATTSHNYALVMTHAVTYTNKFQEVKRKIFVDLVKFWTPTEDGPVNIMEVEKAIFELCRRFNVASVTFDQWNSAQTIQRLKAKGINAKETKFTTSYINAIYGELKSIVNMEDLVLYPHHHLIGEMKHLKYKILRSGFQRFFDKESSFPSDDCCDALAGSAYMALHKQVTKKLPRSTLVRSPWR